MEFKILKTFLDKNDPLYYFGIPIVLKEPKYEVYRRHERSWRTLWLTWWSYFATFQTDPKLFLDKDKIIKSNYHG